MTQLHKLTVENISHARAVRLVKVLNQLGYVWLQASHIDGVLSCLLAPAPFPPTDDLPEELRGRICRCAIRAVVEDTFSLEPMTEKVC